MAATEFEIEYTNAQGDTEYLDVEFTGNPHIENDGIGAYEYWGQRCYDRGVDYPVCDDWDWDHTKYTEEQNQIIERFADENCERIGNKICESWEEPDYPDYEDYDRDWEEQFDPKSLDRDAFNAMNRVGL